MKQGKPLSYLERLQQSQEDKNSKAELRQAANAKLQLQSDILATEQSVADAEDRLEAAKSSIQFSAQSVVTAQIELEQAQDGLKRIKALEAELFPA
jgi:outer membrane protein TolC